MKKFLIIFIAAFFLFAQDNETLPDTQTVNADVQADTQTIDTVQQQPQIAENEIAVEEPSADTAEIAETNTEKKIYLIFFAGIQVGQAPEISERFEDMIRTQLDRESNIDFVPKDVSVRICRKLFLDKKITINTAFFDELEKYNLKNTIVLLVDIEEYSIKVVRRFLIAAGVEGKLKANFLFYDTNMRKELFLAKASSISVVKKGLVGVHSPETRINISSADIIKINDHLLKDVVEQGFNMLEIAISFKK
jgi:hypothetical protein